MRMSDRPSLARRSSSSSRIWAWTMTSRAVVGSSPMTIAGSQARAIAIIARWRIPPDSSCGYARAALLRDADQLEQLAGPLRAPPSRDSPRRSSMRLGDLVADPADRVEGVHRALEDDADLAPAVAPQRVLGLAATRSMPMSLMLPSTIFAFAGQEPDERQRGRRLAAARLAGDPERLAVVEREADAVDRLDRSRLEREVGLEVLDDEERAFGSACLGSGRSRRPWLVDRPARAASPSSSSLRRPRRAAPRSGRAPRSRRRAASSPGRWPGGIEVRSSPAPPLRVEDVVERAADEREGEDDEDDAGARRARSTTTRRGPARRPSRAASRIWPHDGWNGSPRPMNDERRLGQDRAGEDEHGVGDDEVDDVRQDVAAHDVAAARRR